LIDRDVYDLFLVDWQAGWKQWENRLAEIPCILVRTAVDRPEQMLLLFPNADFLLLRGMYTEHNKQDLNRLAVQFGKRSNWLKFTN
jgi:hypothetical protein